MYEGSTESAVLASFGGLAGALVWWCFGWLEGGPIDLYTTAKFLSIGLTLVNLPIVLHRFLSGFAPLGLLVGYGLWFLSLLFELSATIFGWVGVVSLLASLYYCWNGKIRLRQVAGAAFVGGFSWVLVLSGFYHLPSWETAFVNAGQLKLDTIYHASIANLASNYGAVTSGIEGLTPLSYHVGSHYVMGWVSQVAEVAVLDVYNSGFCILLLPPLLFGVRRGVAVCGDALQVAPQETKVWIGIAALLCGLLPYDVGHAQAYQLQSVFKSESYAFAIIGLLLAFGALGSHWVRLLKGELSGGNRYVLFATTCVFAYVIGLAKISVPFVLLPPLGYLLLRIGLWKDVGIYAAFSIGTLFLLYLGLGGGMYGESHYNPAFPILKFKEGFSVLFSQPWLFLYALIRIGAKEPNRELLRGRKFLDVEFFTVMTMISLLPGLLIPIPSKSEVYFSDVPTWFIGPACIALLASKDLRKLPILGMILGAQILIHCVGNVMNVGVDYLKFKACLQGEMSRCEEVDVKLAADYKEKKDQREKALAALQVLSERRLRKTGVFIDPNSEYWSLNPDPRAMAFLVPAVSGLPIFGALAQLPDATNHYGLDGLKELRVNSPQTLDAALEVVCASGFLQVAEIDVNMTLVIHECD